MAEEDIVGRVSAVFDPVQFTSGANMVQRGLEKFAQDANKTTQKVAQNIKANLAPAQQAIANVAKAASSTPTVGVFNAPNKPTGPVPAAPPAPQVKLTRAQISANAAQNAQNAANAKALKAQQKHWADLGRLQDAAYREDARRTAWQVKQADTARSKWIKEQEREEARLRREARTAARREMEAEGKRQRALERQQNREANQERRRNEAAERRIQTEARRDYLAVQRVQDRIVQAPAPLQTSILGSIQGPQAQAQRRTLMASGMTRMQAMAFQMQQVQGINQQAALWAVGGGGVRPPTFGGRVPGGGGPGSPGGFMGRLGRFGASLATGLGIGVGAFGAGAIAQGARALVEQAGIATAYERQSIAAENLAGSQDKLNQLLEAYDKASGDAVAKTTALSNVTRLMATGFANSAEDVEKFVRATRGASIALGKPQDYVIQETQLAISNTSVKRLDQIGLGIDEVNQRIEELRETNKEWSREMAFQDAVLGLMNEKYGALTETAEGQATGIERLSKAWADFLLVLGEGARGPLDEVSRKLAEILNFYSNAYNPNKRLIGSRLVEEEGQVRELSWVNQQSVRFDQWIKELMIQAGRNKVGLESGISPDRDLRIAQYNAGVAAQRPWVQVANDFYDPSLGGTPPRRELGPLGRYGEDAQAIMIAAYEQEQAIIKNAYDRRNDAIAQYEEQRTQVAADFAKMMVREEEDFARQRARSLRDYERSIMDVMRDAQEREADAQEELDERIADLREDSQERISDIEEKYNKDREKAEKDHRDRLMKAAGQLDAIAVLEERKRWKEEGKEREEAHREAIAEQQESLAEQIEEAREAHAEQLEDAREADAERLEDMRVARAQQLADEDEDRALRKARAIEDHNAQLDEMARQHELTLEKIEEEAEAEREALADALEKDLAEVGVYIAGYHKKMEERDRLVEQWVEGMIARMEREIAQDALNDERDSATGTYRYDPQRGPMIPHDYGAALTNSNVSYGTVTNSKILNIQPGAIQVTAQPGMEVYVADIVRDEMIRLMEDY